MALALLVERRLDDSGGYRAAANLDLERRPFGGERRRNVADADRLLHRRAHRAAGHLADLLAVFDDRVVRARNAGLGQLEADQLACDALCFLLLQRLGADEPGRLVELDDPPQR